jgi:hypothetical protein
MDSAFFTSKISLSPLLFALSRKCKEAASALLRRLQNALYLSGSRGTLFSLLSSN